MLDFLIARKLLGRSHPRLALPPYLQRISDSLWTELYSEALRIGERLSPSERQAIQRRRIASLLRRLQAMPFFRERIEHGEQGLEAIPPLSKEEMRLAFDAGTCWDRRLAAFRIPQHTSGSTGIPFHFYLDANMLPRRRAVYRRLTRWVGREGENAVLSLMPRIHPGLEQEAEFLRCDDPEDAERKFAVIANRLQGAPMILQSRTSHLLRLAQLVEQRGAHCNIRAIISYTEELSPPIRSYLERIFGAPVFNYYASNETTAIAQECEYREGLHVNDDWVLVEITDTDGRPVPAGTPGEVLVTSLDNEVMPFIRYRIGDRGRWLPELCRCGRTLPRIEIEGRSLSSFPLPDGRTGYFASLIYPVSLLVAKILKYRVTRRATGDFLVEIVPLPDFTPADYAFVQERLGAYLGQAVGLTVRLVERLESGPSGKQRAFVNEGESLHTSSDT